MGWRMHWRTFGGTNRSRLGARSGGELAAKPLLHVAAGEASEASPRREPIESVGGAGVDAQVGGDAGTGEANGVVDVFVEEAIEGADHEVGWWEAGEVGGAGGGGVGRGLSAETWTEVGAPAGLIGARGPDGHFPAAGWGGHAVVDHWVDKELEGDLELGAVADEEGEAGGEPAAGGGAADAEAVAVDTELGGVVDDPVEGGVAIFEWAGVGRFGGEAVFDGDADAAECGAPASEAEVVHGAGAEDVAAAVHVVERGEEPGGFFGPVDADDDVGGAGGARDGEVAPLDGIGEGELGDHGLALGAKRGEVVEGEAVEGGHAGEGGGDFGVEEGGGVHGYLMVEGSEDGNLRGGGRKARAEMGR